MWPKRRSQSSWRPYDHRVSGVPEVAPFSLVLSGWQTRYSCWGGRKEGERLFGRLLSLRNDVGLLSEEYDVSASRLVGNFPQAFSHVALVNTAQNIARPSMPAEQRAGESKPGA